MHGKMMIKKTDLTEFFELLLSLIQSGFTLTSALKILSDKKETEKYAKKIRPLIEEGESVSKALCAVNRKLEPYETLLAVTEETGEIGPALKGIVEELKEAEEGRRNLIAVSLYPAAVCLLSLSLSIVLLNYGVSYINLIAEISNRQIIKTVVAANLTLLCLMLLLFILLRYFWYRYDFETFLFRDLYYLSKSSVGMEEAFILLLGEKSFSKKELKCITYILGGLREGKSLYKVFEESGRFDVFCLSWLYIAGESGEVIKATEKIYENYRIKKKYSRERAQQILEPVLIAMSGIYVLILICGCVIPVFMTLGSKIL